MRIEEIKESRPAMVITAAATAQDHQSKRRSKSNPSFGQIRWIVRTT
jgi:hypothetical protein